jgi:hypothetical protein
MATVGFDVSFEKLRESGEAAFPAASEWFAVRVTVPSDAPEKSTVVDQVPEEQATVFEASPERTTLRVSSEQVPDTAKEVWFALLTNEPPAGEVIATVGTTTSFKKFREA